MGRKVVIVGGVACGTKVAARLRRLDPEAEITVLEKGEHLSYAGCGLPYVLGGLVKDMKELMCTPLGIVRDAAFFRSVKNVDVRTRTLVTRIDRENRVVHARDLENEVESPFPYDALVLATGGNPIRPSLPGADQRGVAVLWTLEDALRIKAILDAGTARKAVIVGAGLIGLEMVEALTARGLQVSLVELLPQPLAALMDPEFGARIADALRDGACRSSAASGWRPSPARGARSRGSGRTGGRSRPTWSSSPSGFGPTRPWPGMRGWSWGPPGASGRTPGCGPRTPTSGPGGTAWRPFTG
jgi:NADPH-dependent 2,4-dienoyl-CoA reductase/sulfur reductase-like enzyme